MPSIQQASHLRHPISQLPRINQSLKNMGKNRLEMKENVKQHQYRNFSFVSFLFMAHFSYLTSLFSISLIYFRVFLLFLTIFIFFSFLAKMWHRTESCFRFSSFMFAMVTKTLFFLRIFCDLSSFFLPFQFVAKMFISESSFLHSFYVYMCASEYTLI